MIEPLNNDWAWLDALVGPLDDDFVQAVNEKPGQQERPALDKLFQRERLGDTRDRH
jgi:antitoxin VapB